MRNFVAALILISAVGATALWSETPNIQTVSIESRDIFSGDEAVPGYLALPGGNGRHPGIIVLHENWGLRDWIKQQIQKLAEQGYVVLGVDLYHGKLPKDNDDGENFSNTLSRPRAYRDSEAAFAYLAGRQDVDPSHIGVIGWAMGGRYAIQLAVHEPRLAACVDNYGAFPVDPPEIEKINASVLGIFGGADPTMGPDKVHVFEDAMRAAGKSIEIKIYDNAAHEFLDPDNPRRDAHGGSLYRPEAADDAWKLTTAFFAKTLKSSKTK
jgi:carboxymethylenebutenolidase